ncbi:MAG: 3-isopropylmalate dehydratase small subunit [Candidatus Rokubacteria bacterium]|nr:3-isopropylmalate dehydratase small subunit [Candidatus Rokubacteria bacterium]
MIVGRVWTFGDDVNTDVITPGKYLTIREPEKLAPHIMEGIDPEFTRKAKPGDLIVAGKNFGCGSSRETAPAAIKAFGIGSVIAVSFARIFLRNAVNIALPILECPAAAQAIREGDEVAVDVAAGRITDRTTGVTFEAAPFPPFMRELMAAGGLVPYTRRRLGLG